MELALRPPVMRFHPLMKPRRGFAGMGADPGVNVTTMWTPTGGFVGSGGGAPAAVYQTPAVIPNPSCLQDTGPGGTAFSDACQQQLHAVQQQRFQLANNANFQVDYANCVGQGLDPSVCASRTYGLTPAGGYTSDAGAGPGGSQLIVDANGNPVLAPPPVYTGPPLPGMTPGSGGGQGSTHTVLAFTNLTSGDNTNFKVGDRWQIKITGAAPNAPVTVSGGMSGGSTFASQGMTSQGTTDSSGNFTMNGQMDQSQIGSWSESWSIAGAPISSFSFNVSAVGSTGGGTAPSTSTTSVFGTLPGGSVTIGGTSVPWLAIGAGVVALFLLMRK